MSELGKPVSDIELAWVSDHYAELAAKFPNEWIAVVGETLITHAKDLRSIRDECIARDIHGAFTTKLSGGDLPEPLADENARLRAALTEVRTVLTGSQVFSVSKLVSLIDAALIEGETK